MALIAIAGAGLLVWAWAIFVAPRRWHAKRMKGLRAAVAAEHLAIAHGRLDVEPRFSPRSI